MNYEPNEESKALETEQLDAQHEELEIEISNWDN